jgi:hypothetical protein
MSARLLGGRGSTQRDGSSETMSALSVFNLALAALCGGLGWLTYAAYEAPPAELAVPAMAGAGPTDAAAAPSFRPFRMPPQQRFSELVERPPFTQSRRPAQVSAEPVARREAPRRDLKLTLIGVILQPDRQYALVQRPGKKEAQRLARGEKIDGWQVEGILPDRVILSQAKEVVELELKDAKIKRPKAKRRQPRQARSADAKDRRQSTAANPALRREAPAQGQQRPEDDEGEEELPENLRRALQQETQ